MEPLTVSSLFLLSPSVSLRVISSYEPQKGHNVKTDCQPGGYPESEQSSDASLSPQSVNVREEWRHSSTILSGMVSYVPRPQGKGPSVHSRWGVGWLPERVCWLGKLKMFLILSKVEGRLVGCRWRSCCAGCL